MEILKKTSDLSHHSTHLSGRNGVHYSDQLLGKAQADADTLLKELDSRLSGLSDAEVNSRLKQYGTNEIAREKHRSGFMRLLSNVKNPLVLLLIALGVLSYLTGDHRATAVIFVMVVLGVVLAWRMPRTWAMTRLTSAGV